MICDFERVDDVENCAECGEPIDACRCDDCPECGANLDGQSACPECGYIVDADLDEYDGDL